MVAIREQFRDYSPGRESEWARQRRWFIKAKQEHQRREEAAEKLDDSLSALGAATSVATSAQIKEFKVKLDTYDTATVEALMENQELLDAVNDRLDDMLSRAHVLEDGRRVFRTEDGKQVFDEFGVEVSADEIVPGLIDPTKPTWEAFSSTVEERDMLVRERTEILEFQEKIDAARERVDGADISESDLEELDAELADLMPDTVRKHAGLEPREPEPAPANRVAPVKTATVEVATSSPMPM